jgi:imidazole glycerol-phosphate synthase subunit HisF
MMLKRVIPVLLLMDKALYKPVKFDKPVYIGDPLNAVKIFNEKEVDELIVLDILATKQKSEPDYGFIEQLAGECFMPLTYGGGINNIEQIRRLNACGIEKVCINSMAADRPAFIEEAAKAFGSSTIVISVDVKKDLFGKYKVYIHNGRKNTGLLVNDHVRRMEDLGAGEIVITSIDREGTYKGLDLQLIQQVSALVHIPVIGHGGANSLENMGEAMKVGASAVAAGSLFVYKGPHKAVLINYPKREELIKIMEIGQS